MRYLKPQSTAEEDVSFKNRLYPYSATCKEQGYRKQLAWLALLIKVKEPKGIINPLYTFKAFVKY